MIINTPRFPFSCTAQLQNTKSCVFFFSLLTPRPCPSHQITMTSVTNSSLSFGDHYAVLNLDWMSVLINAVKDTHEGQAMIENCSKWNDAVHQKSPHPLTVFSALSFNPGQPEVQPNSPFANLIVPYGEFRNDSPEVQIDGHFKIHKEDVVLQKTRWSATMGNSLEQILRAQNIKTVIIVCDSLSLFFPPTQTKGIY